MKKTVNIITISIIFSILASLFNIGEVFAYDLKVEYTRSLTLEDGYLEVEETKKVSNTSYNKNISAKSINFILQQYSELGGNMLEEEIKTVQTSPSESDIQRKDNYYQIDIPFGEDLGPGQTRNFSIKYKSYQLIEKVGLATNIYIPKQEIITDIPYDYIERIKIVIPSNLTSDTFLSPTPNNTYTSGDKTIYEYKDDQLTEHSALIQIGNSQLFKFEIIEDIPATFNATKFKNIAINEIIMALPTEYNETNQKTYIESINPKPERIIKDEEGNTFAVFLIPASTSQQIKISGYISINIDRSKEVTTAKLSDIPNEIKEKYTKSEKYWETNSQEVQDAVNSLPKSTDILEIIENSYNYVIDKFEYDQDKYQNNTRMGAKKALSGQPTVCMEYADTLIALLRAQGVPAKAAYGRGFNSKLSQRELEDHEWVQAYVPGYGWLTVDPTWGESGRKYIGADIERVLWYTASKGPDNPSPLSHISVENLQLDPPQLDIYPLNDKELNFNSTDLDSLTTDNKFTENDILTRIKLSPLPRIVEIYFLPIAISISIIIFFTILSLIFRRRKNENRII